MNKTMISIITALSMTFTLSADHWQNHWQSAVKHCENKQYEEAEVEFGLCINEMEAIKEIYHPHVYVDRARLFLMQNRYNECLIDVNLALESSYLVNDDKVRALMTRISACANLGIQDQMIKDYETFKSVSSNFPEVEYTQDSVIIRNMPKSDCYRNIAKGYFLASGICENEADITELSSGIMIVKRKPCDCGCDKMTEITKKNKQDDINACNFWCDNYALGGTIWCGRSFTRWDCQAACVFSVELIKKGCFWCCSNGDVYATCVAPFENILMIMGKYEMEYGCPCIPIWN